MHRHVWLRCVSALGGVVVPEPFDLDELCRRLSTVRGRRLVVVSVHTRVFRAGVCLPWFAAKDTDYVLYGRTAPRRLEHRAVHAIAHLLLGHRGHPPPSNVLPRDAPADGGLPQWDWPTPHGRLGLTVSVAGAWAEAEADVLAGIVLRRFDGRDGAPAALVDSSGAASL